MTGTLKFSESRSHPKKPAAEPSPDDVIRASVEVRKNAFKKQGMFELDECKLEVTDGVVQRSIFRPLREPPLRCLTLSDLTEDVPQPCSGK